MSYGAPIVASAASPIDLVEQFHAAFDYRYPSPVEPSLDENTIALRIRLLTEEKDELFKAIADDSKAEMLDALCDLQYVLSGAVLALGLRELYDKQAQRDSEFHGYGYDTPLRISETLALTVRATLLSIKIKYTGHALSDGNVSSAVASFYGIQRIIDGLVDACGFTESFTEAFAAVHENNMGKLWDAELTVMTNWPDLTFVASRVSGKYIARRIDGKIVKPPGHGKVDLGRFIK